MTLNGKNMNEWLLEQVNKREEEIHEKEDEIHKKDESIQWIKWTVPLSMVLVLVGFYFISEFRTTDVLKTSVPLVLSNGGGDHSKLLDFSSVLDNQSDSTQYSNIWGKENMEFTPEKELKVFYPKGSYSPSSNPRGGAGFIYKLDKTYDMARLSYKVKFEQGFDFVQGGKLPGFCSGTCPRGGTDIGTGFSTRFMWRKDGVLEGYLYIPGTKGAYGKSFGRGSFQFESGKYYKVEQELKLNTPGKNDGLFVIHVDGKEVFSDSSIKFREGMETKIDSIIFSTFFGGSDGSFATPKDIHTFFKDFTLSY